MLAACKSCHQLRLHKITQEFMVTPELLIVMITKPPKNIIFTQDEMRAIETLNTDLSRNASNHTLPEIILGSDFENIYTDEYRRLKDLIQEQPNMTEPTPESINKILSPKDTYSL